MIPRTPAEIPTAELLAMIAMLSRPPYLTLSAIHTEFLELLELEARTRK